MRSLRSLIVVAGLIIAVPAAWACSKFDPNQWVSPGAYYMGINTTLTGEAMKSQLNSLIKGHKSQSYSCVWTILKESDEDPYNSNNVIGLYTRRSIPKSMQDNGSNGSDAWNREHVWAKSHGFPSKSQDGYTDAHHLRPADKSVNSSRGHEDFDDGGSPHYECSGCRSDSDSWEPPDEVKGDIARMMFYMVVRYEGSDSSGTPDLELVNVDTDSGDPEFGWLDTLLDWHNQDPVSSAELDRNQIIYEWQGNRNPFIDHPEWVANIWGGGSNPPPNWDYTDSGYLSNGQVDYHPNGNYFYSGSGLHEGELVGPGGSVDFDLELYQWNGSSWQRVAYSWYGDPVETVSYNGSAGYYFWAAISYSGSGNYTIRIDQP